MPEDWRGHSIGELDIRRKYGVNILGVKRDSKTDVNISPKTVLDADMTRSRAGAIWMLDIPVQLRAMTSAPIFFCRCACSTVAEYKGTAYRFRSRLRRGFRSTVQRGRTRPVRLLR